MEEDDMVKSMAIASYKDEPMKEEGSKDPLHPPCNVSRSTSPYGQKDREWSRIYRDSCGTQYVYSYTPELNPVLNFNPLPINNDNFYRYLNLLEEVNAGNPYAIFKLFFIVSS
jgi:hypothetical protein